MSSLFALKQLDKKRSVPNGGLGGFVLPPLGESGQEAMDAASVPLTKGAKSRSRLPPIRISRGVENDAVVASQASGGSSVGCGGQWTPKTPTDRLRLSSAVESKLYSRSAPLLTGCDCASPYHAPCYSPPETPISPLNSQPIELPGSLLLPSQGFPQPDPISPPPSLRIVRRDTDESTASVSSVPTLSTSISSDVETMETFRNLTTTLRKHDRSADQPMPATHLVESRPAKPLSAMSIEELLDYLPECNPSTVTQSWLPAVRDQFQKMIALLNDVGELKIESSLNQIAFQKDLKSFSDEIRLIAASYHKVLESAESLVERDTKGCHERLKELEEQVADALEKMGAKDEEIAEQIRTNAELGHTIHDIVRILGSFIHDNVSSWVNTIDEPRTEEVLQVISDYSRHADSSTKSVPYVRVPESAIMQYARDIREAKALSKQYQGLVHGQSTMINEHSRNLDAYTNKYEIAVRLIKERDHEVLLLVQKMETVTKRLQECEAALVQSQESMTEVERKAGRYDELRGNMESLKIAHTLEVAQRDDEITSLRQMLGSAREEVFARRADVKNIISQTQSGFSAFDLPSTTAKGGPTSKALRFFGMDRDKERGRRVMLPSSQSMVGFTSSHHDATANAFDARYSSKEVAPAKSGSFLRSISPLGKRRHAETGPNTPADGSDSRSDPLGAFPATVRPRRSDSLGATQRHGVLGSPINTQKALPDPPAHTQPQLISAARLAEITQSVDSPDAAQIASDYFQNSILGRTASRRVLSNIPEVSAYSSSDAGDAKDQNSNHEQDSDGSVASSDREVYRKSICALDMLTSSALPYSETEPDVEAIMRGVPGSEYEYEYHHTNNTNDFNGEYDVESERGVARVLHLRPDNHDLRAVMERERNSDREERYRQSFVSDGSGYRSEGSEPMTVAQLYHRGHRHIRG